VQRLISNAIKYTPDNGKLSISVRHSHEKLTTDSKGSVLIEVMDTGYGIPKHQQAKVFTKLFRADNIKRKDTDGTGLGLYITKALVEHMGGKIWFTSEQNKGSQFSVLLPIEGIKKRS
jgi:two-component system sensor histidine kinase VicK